MNLKWAQLAASDRGKWMGSLSLSLSLFHVRFWILRRIYCAVSISFSLYCVTWLTPAELSTGFNELGKLVLIWLYFFLINGFGDQEVDFLRVLPLMSYLGLLYSAN